MRYPLMTIHDANDIEITVTKEFDEKEFLSGEVVNGVVIYCEQWKPEFDDFAVVSFLIEDNNISLLKAHLFSKKEIQFFVNKIKELKDEIVDYINEQKKEKVFLTLNSRKAIKNPFAKIHQAALENGESLSDDVRKR